MKHLFYLTITLLFFTACNNDDNNGATITLSFSHNFDGTGVTASDFNQLKFKNAHGDSLNISRLRYLISSIRLYKSNGDSIILDGHQLVDLTNGTGLSFSPGATIPKDTYAGVSFVFGFDQEGNIPKAYPDLNSVTFNWPEMLGDGYHFMQFEGKFGTTASLNSFAYHMGTAKVSTGVFEANHFRVSLPGFTLSNNATIEVKMNIAEWFKNPHTWNLNVFSQTLMPNYTAQKMMQANGRTAFSLGTITQ